ncbi:hypothetical protein DUNSADRAFT_1405 [Dunaliella salina]|uniref:Uncharacterized protein n=1 Tax=Dunaliella salina TaxID=3046 RepID=A0ABQ7GX49_DUNSA|nr:hypothetical protein DUNSADRAFT_1405 [Dunaliella salina]|eukprot:KAF5839178.1 hypothetical protein DUNSADRAFT_1405 [Dunaliella salina]
MLSFPGNKIVNEALFAQATCFHSLVPADSGSSATCFLQAAAGQMIKCQEK